MAAATPRPAAKLPAFVVTYTSKLTGLSSDKIDQITQAWSGGTKAEVDKWTAWVNAAKLVGLDLDDLQPVKGKEALTAQNDAMNAFIDTVFSGLKLGYLRADNDAALKAKDKKRLAIIKVRRSEMRGVIEFGNLIGDTVLDAFRDPDFRAHKATTFGQVISACRKAREAAGEANRKLTKGEVMGVVEAVLAPEEKAELSPEEQRDALRDRIIKAIGKLMKISNLSLNDRAAMINVMDVALGLATPLPAPEEKPQATPELPADAAKADKRAASKAEAEARKAARKAEKLAAATTSNATVLAGKAQAAELLGKLAAASKAAGADPAKVAAGIAQAVNKLTVEQLAKRRATSASNNTLHAGGTREDAKAAADAAAAATTETVDATKARKLATAAKASAAKARKLAAAAKATAAKAEPTTAASVTAALKDADDLLSEL